MRESVEYLGRKVDSTGLHTTNSKVEAISRAPRPKNVQELLQANWRWKWTLQCDKAFEKAKKLLIAASVLAHYNPALPIWMAGNASAYGTGAVSSHVFKDGGERPIAFASRTLSASEHNYAQVEKEAL